MVAVGVDQRRGQDVGVEYFAILALQDGLETFRWRFACQGVVQVAPVAFAGTPCRQ
jgi:hypothetical protein